MKSRGKPQIGIKTGLRKSIPYCSKWRYANCLIFPSIPEKVTINEFLEIAKEYSTPKSSIFINGILDKLVREYKSGGKLKKVGRGLL